MAGLVDKVIFLDEASVIMAAKATMFVVSPLVFVLLFFVTAPWGRHEEGTSPWWGVRIPPRLAWLVMESGNFVSVFFFVHGAQSEQTMNRFFLALYLLHYFNRAFIYPFRANMVKPVPLTVFVLAGTWCLFNGVCHGLWLGSYAVFSEDWATQTQTIVGVILFFTGLFINIVSDDILTNLRKPGDKGYYIPHGAFFDLVTSSNYFGETVEWMGLALATNSWVSWAFVVFTFANLFPRAWANHQWYLERFPKYPKNRKAFFPYLL
jgi:hypothetical protein